MRDFLETLQRKYPDLRVTVLTSLADGADRLVADVAKSLHDADHLRAADADASCTSGTSTRHRSASIESCCGGSNVLTLPLVGDSTADEVTHPGARARSAVCSSSVRSSRRTATSCSRCGTATKTALSGGTAAIIRYHQDDYMPGLTDGEPRSRLDDTDDESDLVYHVVCSRDRPDGAPTAPLRAGEAWWLSRDHETPRTREMPTRYEVVLRRMVEFSQDATRHRGLIEQRTERVAARTISTSSIDHGERAIAAVFSVADWLAKHYRDAHAHALWVLLGFAGLAGFCFIAYGEPAGLGI